ncbi:hypothetical protein [Variovorax gossypii]
MGKFLSHECSIAKGVHASLGAMNPEGENEDRPTNLFDLCLHPSRASAMKSDQPQGLRLGAHQEHADVSQPERGSSEAMSMRLHVAGSQVSCAP